MDKRPIKVNGKVDVGKLWHKAHGPSYADKPVDPKDRKLMQMTANMVRKKGAKNA